MQDKGKIRTTVVLPLKDYVKFKRACALTALSMMEAWRELAATYSATVAKQRKKERANARKTV